MNLGIIMFLLVTVMVGTFTVMYLTNLYKARGAFSGSKEVHFYDLGPAAVSSDPYADDEETDEDYIQAVAELNEYIAQKKAGMHPVLTDKIRDRFIPVTLKSVFVFTVLHYLQFMGKIVFCILAVALVYGIVLIM